MEVAALAGRPRRGRVALVRLRVEERERGVRRAAGRVVEVEREQVERRLDVQGEAVEEGLQRVHQALPVSLHRFGQRVAHAVEI